MEKHLVYQKYMERVVETAEEFQEIREILARHDTLITTHQVKCLTNLYFTFV